MAETKKKTKKIPERLCLGCQQKFLKKDLLRIVHEPSGNFSVDDSGKKQGRGAYLCKKLSCFESAVKQKKFLKSFRVSPEEFSQDVVAKLRQDFEKVL